MAKVPAQWNIRIVRYGLEDPEQLLAHDKNFRIHPAAQQRAMSAVLRSIGVVQNIIVNDRTQKVLDGHMRIQIAITEKQARVPVTFVDLDEAEEAAVLASFDPIGSLAVADHESLAQLLADVDSTDPELTAFFSDMYSNATEKVEKKNAAKKDKKPKTITCPNCRHCWAD